MHKTSASLFGLLVLVLICTSACVPAEISECDIICQLEIDQSQPLTVQAFVDILEEKGWVQPDPERTFYATYSSEYSQVLETTTTITLDGDAPAFYGDELLLFIGYVGGGAPNHAAVPGEALQRVRVIPDMTIPESWFAFGLPQSGWVLPFFGEEVLPNGWCVFSYDAYYREGQVIVRASVSWPPLLSLWTAEIGVDYPIGEENIGFPSDLRSMSFMCGG
ncbi:MAG: hypothetical protein SF029_24065 [bacterium]|nr:hypothetical protein [bacterium]